MRLLLGTFAIFFATAAAQGQDVKTMSLTDLFKAGFEIKAAFWYPHRLPYQSDNTKTPGEAYVILQKGEAAYYCPLNGTTKCFNVRD